MFGLFEREKPMTMVQAVAHWERDLQAAVIAARLAGVYPRTMIEALEAHAKALRFTEACK
jgi:hypothetical protein